MMLVRLKHFFISLIQSLTHFLCTTYNGSHIGYSNLSEKSEQCSMFHSVLYY